MTLRRRGPTPESSLAITGQFGAAARRGGGTTVALSQPAHNPWGAVHPGSGFRQVPECAFTLRLAARGGRQPQHCLHPLTTTHSTLSTWLQCLILELPVGMRCGGVPTPCRVHLTIECDGVGQRQRMVRVLFILVTRSACCRRIPMGTNTTHSTPCLTPSHQPVHPVWPYRWTGVRQFSKSGPQQRPHSVRG
jgi:hypothetical protein